VFLVHHHLEVLEDLVFLDHLGVLEYLEDLVFLVHHHLEVLEDPEFLEYPEFLEGPEFLENYLMILVLLAHQEHHQFL
jgi:hypothetical protein